jgi:hypothetical protein
MSDDGGVRKARHHLVLPVEVWEALTLEARQRRKRISHVVQERLVASLGILGGSTLPSEGAADLMMAEAGKRHHCRLAVERRIWNRLAYEAATRKVSVTERIRQRLREAVLGEAVGTGWGPHGELAAGVRESRAPESGGEPKSITMLEL